MNNLLMTDVIRNLLRYPDVQTDHGVFRLHYKLTASLLFMCSVLVSATQFFGDPIMCLNYELKSEILNNYCWVEGTITLPRSLNGTLDDDVAAPGVDQRKISADEPVIEHLYYQWVALFLFFQAITFYFPRWLWRHWEDGRVKHLISGLSKPAIEEDAKKASLKTIVNYFRTHRYENQTYAYRFFYCELLTLGNVIFQLYLLDLFLNHQFWNYGPSALAFLADDPEIRVDPMARVFPKITKCRLKRFGTSGEVQIHDAICLLSLNIINEKIFVFLWFWFVLLLAITLSSLIYRSFIIAAPQRRSLLLSKLSRMVEPEDLKSITRSAQYGDWFLLSLLKDNVKAHHFRDVVHELSEDLNNGRGKTAGDKVKLNDMV